MGTIVPWGLVTPTPTPANLANIETTATVTVEKRVFCVHPDITAIDWELTCL